MPARHAACVAIRPADLEADAEYIMGAVRHYLNPRADQRRFTWLYRECPLGPPRVWVAEDPAGRPIGMAAAFPRHVWVRGGLRPAWVLGDFCIAETHRSLGPALQLQKACLAELAAPDTVVYDFPGRTMLPIYRRLGLDAGVQLTRFTRLLHASNGLRSRSLAFFALVAGRIADAAAEVVEAWPRRARGLELHWQAEPCGPEFTALAHELGPTFGFCVERTGEYLTWRYLRAPDDDFRMLAARRDGRLIAYVVLRASMPTLEVVDLFGAPTPWVARTLLAAALRTARDAGFARVCATFLETHPWTPYLRQLGFWPRERHQLVVSGPALTPPSPHSPWIVVQGDRDS